MSGLGLKLSGLGRKGARLGAALALATTALVLVPGGAGATHQGNTFLVSVATNGLSGEENSYDASISGDGRYVVFYSEANNLVPGDTNAWGDVFVRDLETGATELVSVDSYEGQFEARSWDPAISFDGRYVVFATSDPDAGSGCVIRDRLMGSTEPMTVNWESIGCLDPSISADGQKVAFVETMASAAQVEDPTWCGDYPNLIGDVFPNRDVYVWSGGGPLHFVSMVSDPMGNHDVTHDSSQPVISASGMFVAFESRNTDLLPEGVDTNDVGDVFLRQLPVSCDPGARRISEGTFGQEGDNASWNPSISFDGQDVAYASHAANLSPLDRNSRSDIFVTSPGLLGGSFTSLVSLASDGAQGDADSYNPAISSGGDFVAYESWATNLVPGDTNGTGDVFVGNRVGGGTTRVSLAFDGAQADNGGYNPSISEDGRYVAFHSAATNLAPRDVNSKLDVFVHDKDRSPTQRPEALPDSYYTAEGTSLTVGAPGVLGNDSDHEDDPLSAELVGGEHHGTLSLAPDGSFAYTPSPGFSGNAWFSYRAVDQEGATSDLATVTISVKDCPQVTDTVESIKGTVAVPSPVLGTAGISFDVKKVVFLGLRFYLGLIRIDDIASGLPMSKNGAVVLAPSLPRTGVNGATGTAWGLTTFAIPWRTFRMTWSVDDLSTSGCDVDRVSLALTGGVSYSVSASATGGDVTVLPSGPAPSPGGTSRVSVGAGGTQGDADSSIPSMSSDARYVAFSSSATNLVPGDTNGTGDVFVHDRQAGTTTRVSVASDGTEGDGLSHQPSISGDGRYVAFWSIATNLVPGDANGWGDVFVHDRQAGTTERVSVASDGTEGDDESSSASISADGRYVAFLSAAPNLVSGDTNGVGDVFVHDHQAGITERVSVASDGTEADDWTYSASVSSDGRYVAFSADATNLAPGDTNGTSDVFVRDRQSGTTDRVSVGFGGTQGNDWSDSPSISADGRYVAFLSAAPNLVWGDANGVVDAFVMDRQSTTTTRVSVATDGTEGDADTDETSISGDGRYVAFWSIATNLVPGDANGWGDVFLRDRQTPDTSRASVATDGTEGNSSSYWASLSSDGRYVAFSSWASNLVSGDTNGTSDVFVRDRQG